MAVKRVQGTETWFLANGWQGYIREVEVTQYSEKNVWIQERSAQQTNGARTKWIERKSIEDGHQRYFQKHEDAVKFVLEHLKRLADREADIAALSQARADKFMARLDKFRKEVGLA